MHWEQGTNLIHPGWQQGTKAPDQPRYHCTQVFAAYASLGILIPLLQKNKEPSNRGKMQAG